jgi:hypothetical protein
VCSGLGGRCGIGTGRNARSHRCPALRWLMGGAAPSRVRQRMQPASTAPRAMSRVMFSSHRPGSCDHRVSFCGVSGAMARRSVVDAVAAKPQRAGIAQDSWSRMGRPVTGIIPPQNTMDSITEITSMGKIWSCDRAVADIARHGEGGHRRSDGQGQIQLQDRAAHCDRAARAPLSCSRVTLTHSVSIAWRILRASRWRRQPKVPACGTRCSSVEVQEPRAHAQWAKSRGDWLVTRCQHPATFSMVRNRSLLAEPANQAGVDAGQEWIQLGAVVVRPAAHHRIDPSCDLGEGEFDPHVPAGCLATRRTPRPASRSSDLFVSRLLRMPVPAWIISQRVPHDVVETH